MLKGKDIRILTIIAAIAEAVSIGVSGISIHLFKRLKTRTGYLPTPVGGDKASESPYPIDTDGARRVPDTGELFSVHQAITDARNAITKVKGAEQGHMMQVLKHIERVAHWLEQTAAEVEQVAAGIQNWAAMHDGSTDARQSPSSGGGEQTEDEQ